MVAPQIAEPVAQGRLPETASGSELRPDAGLALAGAPQRAAAPLSDLPAAAHPRPTPPHPATTQVAVSVARAVDDGVDRIAIKLQPPELGRIDVRLDFGADGRVQAMVLADRPATLEILRNDARELERALAGAGLETASGGLSFGLRQHANGNGQGGAHGFAPQSSRLPSDDAPPDDGRVPVPKHVLSAASGRLDIQV
jgi:flagellar hook-length control protein FliK